LLVLAAYGVFRLIGIWRQDRTATPEKARKVVLLLGLMAVAVLAGLLLAAVQILPTLELKSLSSRATGLSYAMMTVFSMPPYNPLTLFFPTVLGNPLIGYKGEGLFEELHVYVGIVPLLLVPWAWSRPRRDVNVGFFAILAVVSLLLALGHYTPIYSFLVHVPGFNFFRVPARWLLTVTFSLSILAGYGYDSLVADRDQPESRRFPLVWRILTWVNVAISLVLLAGLALGPRAEQGLEGLARALPSIPLIDRLILLAHGLTRYPLIQPASSPSTVLASLNPALVYILFSNAGFLLIHLWKRGRIAKIVFQVALVSLIVVDLLLAGGTAVNPIREASYFERHIGSTAFLQQNAGLYRVFSLGGEDMVESLLEDMPTAYRLYSAQGHVSQLALSRYEVFLGALAESDTLLDLAGVKYLLAEKGTELPGYASAYADGDLEVYENKSVLPRVFVVHEAEVIATGEEVLRRLLSDDFDPGRIVLLEEKPTSTMDQTVTPPKPDLQPTGQAAPAGSLTSPEGIYLPLAIRGWPTDATIMVYSPHKVVVKTDLPEAGFLVLSDTYYPGWTVSVDGQEGRIYQADYLFRAVPLPQGKHTVEFRYGPSSFRIGLALSLATGALFLAVVVASSLIRRRRGN
jgi:hypothetical protein